MKFTGLTAIATVALLRVVNANFELYRVAIGGNGITANVEGWQVYDGHPACDDTLDWLWRDSDDVSGGKYGVRCEGGDGCGRGADSDPNDIDIAEMNFNSDERHWTYYKDRDGALVDLQDNVVGKCTPNTSEKLSCGQSVGRIEGIRRLTCETGATAGDINGGKPTKRHARDVTY